MKNILLITTGGTIASKESEDGLVPAMSSQEILDFVPSIYNVCSVNTLQLYSIDSTNLEPSHWLGIVEVIEQNYENYDGFVILHGTDTMSYTAAALSYLVQNVRKPIVLTGAQRPIDKEITDAKLNLFDSFLYAADDHSFGVSIVFNGQVIVGTRARKYRSKSFHAFSSIDYPNMALIQNSRILRYIREEKPEGEPQFYHKLNQKVFLMKLIPGMNPVIFQHLKPYYDAMIIESFGVGGIPCYENDRFMTAIEDWVESGKLLVMTTQVPHEGSDMSIYKVGIRVKENYDVLESYDMTLEAMVTKLMWILGQTNQMERIKELLYTPVNHDILQP